MPGDQKKHHHGDLKRALLDEAEKVLETGTFDQISLRSLSAAIGVSPTAPYAHFKTRDALLVTLAVRGFTQLRDALDAASQKRASTPRAGLVRLGTCYLEFAENHPGLYQIMFRNGVALSADAALASAASQAFDRLRQAVMKIPIASGNGSTHEEAALLAWSSVHGFATLRGDQRFSNSLHISHTARSFAEMSADYVISGLMKADP